MEPTSNSGSTARGDLHLLPTHVTRRWHRYKLVFFLESLPVAQYEQTAVRIETQELASLLSELVQRRYKDFGYELIRVPAMPINERVAFIQSFVEKLSAKL